MDLANDCMNASVIAASTSGLPASMSPLILTSIPVNRVYQQLASTCVASSSQTETLAVSRLRVSSRPGFLPEFVSYRMLDAWSLHRSDLQQILLQGVPSANIHLGKKLKKYVQTNAPQTIRIEFSDGTSATCDVLVGCDGIRSNTRAQMMRDEAAITGRSEYLRCVEPRWTGTTAYRILTPASRLAAKNPNHSMLSGGQIVRMLYSTPPCTR